MARWADYPTPTQANAMQSLFQLLMATKPHGWSVVRGDRELVIRPADRTVGKFSITTFNDEFHVAFFSRQLNHWRGNRRYPVSDLPVDVMWQSMQRRSARAGAARD